jgi:hypothetical protein
VVAAVCLLLTGLLVLAGCSGGDDDEPDDARAASSSAVDAETDDGGGDAEATEEPSTDVEETAPPEVDEALLEQAHAHVAERYRILVGPTLDVPMIEFARAAEAGCRAAERAGPDPAAIAEAVDAALPEGPDVPHWRGTALSVVVQYFFVGGCDVPDPPAVIEAAAPYIVDGLADD